MIKPRLRLYAVLEIELDTRQVETVSRVPPPATTMEVYTQPDPSCGCREACVFQGRHPGW